MYRLIFILILAFGQSCHDLMMQCDRLTRHKDFLRWMKGPGEVWCATAGDTTICGALIVEVDRHDYDDDGDVDLGDFARMTLKFTGDWSTGP